MVVVIRWMLAGIVLLTGAASAEVAVRGRVSSVAWANGVLSITTDAPAAHIYAAEPADVGVPLQVTRDNALVALRLPPPQTFQDPGGTYRGYVGQVDVGLASPLVSGTYRVRYGVCFKVCVPEDVLIYLDK